MRATLGDREAGSEPYRPDFGPLDDYLAAWYHWRAVRRDARLTGAEADVQLAVRIERIEALAATRRDFYPS